MGKVLSTFQRGWPGTISRSVDDIVVTYSNKGSAAIAPGTPVFLDASTGGVKPVAGATTFDTFVGFAVRVPSKTPDTYGANTAPYAVGEPVDVLVRGSLTVAVVGSCSAGGAVHVRKADSKLVPSAVADNGSVPLTNCHFRGAPDSSGLAELLISERNIG